MPIDYKEYPENWLSHIVPAMHRRSGGRCEGCPTYPNCQAENGKSHPITGIKVVLTTAHMDHDKDNNYYHPDDSSHPNNNLRHLCQRCHLATDRKQHIASRKYGRNHNGTHQLTAFDKHNKPIKLNTDEN